MLHETVAHVDPGDPVGVDDAEDSAEVVKDGVGRLKKVDVDRYVKPLRKKWRAWAN